MAKLKLILILVLLLIVFPTRSYSADKSSLQFYWKEGCVHCEAEQKFLDQLASEMPDLKIERFEVSNKENAQSLVKKSQELSFNPNSVPVTIIGRNVIIGFDTAEITGERIRTAINNPDKSSQIQDKSCSVDTSNCKVENNTINIPILGKINPNKFSLPMLTIILGLADGFNPCAMWALLALLGLLVGLNSYKKLVIVGGAFIVSSYLIYFIFMSAWLNAFLLIGYIRWIQVIVGLLALAIGVVNIRDFLRTDPQTCKITNVGRRQNIIDKAKNVVAHDWIIISIIGVVLLAIAVNTIEALCSVGIPAVYTKALVDARLSKPVYYGYIAGYNIFYMADDLIVFGLAVLTRKIIIPNRKYTYYGRLLGGLALIVLGVIFIYKPEILTLK